MYIQKDQTDTGNILLKNRQAVYSNMYLFQNIPVTHLGQNRIEYRESRHRSKGTCCTSSVSSLTRYCTSLSSTWMMYNEHHVLFITVIVECGIIFALGVLSRGFVKDKRPNWHSTWKMFLWGLTWESFWERRDSLQDGGAWGPGRRGQGDCHRLIISPPRDEGWSPQCWLTL